MKTVKIYDQYKPIYSDHQNNNSLVSLNLSYREQVNPQRYTLVHQSSGFTTTQDTNLTDEQAKALVNSLYEKSKVLGSSYSNKTIDLDNGYAELKIIFADGKQLNRVIFTESV